MPSHTLKRKECVILSVLTVLPHQPNSSDLFFRLLPLWASKLRITETVQPATTN